MIPHLSTFETYHLIGAGGTGSHLARMLDRYLRHATRSESFIGHAVHVYDGDHVELSNVGRQDFEATDNGLMKADVIAARFDWASHPHYLAPDDVMQLFRSADDIVIICVDNHLIRDAICRWAENSTNATVINLGNEVIGGSAQLYVRRNDVNITPSIRHGHPEIREATGADRSALSCDALAELPGGEQTILANLTAALFGLVALWRYHNGSYVVPEDRTTYPGQWWTELTFDHLQAEYIPVDNRITRGWR